MRFLIDKQLPRALATVLQNLGHHAVHVLDVDLPESMTWRSGHTPLNTGISSFLNMPTLLISFPFRKRVIVFGQRIPAKRTAKMPHTETFRQTIGRVLAGKPASINRVLLTRTQNIDLAAGWR